ALFEGAVQLDLADLAAQGGLSELRDRKAVIRDAVGSFAGVEHLEIKHAVNPHLHIVPRDADLLRDIDGFLLQVVLVGDALHERHEDMEARMNGAAVAPEIFDDIGALLRNDRGGLRDDDDDQDRDHQNDVQSGHELLASYAAAAV